MDQMLGNLLRAGVLLAAAVTAVGGAIYLVKRWEDRAPDLHQFTYKDVAPAAEVSRVTGIAAYALSGHGAGLIQLGVLLLIATPVARVAFSVYAFARQRDVLYVVVTVIVLVLLLFSLFGSGFS
ncbi:MAG TPA: DUF1634 domain-containing protein [Planctomycetales bacterium]|nr:DUF1634 domain-containing protein [Planctomycetales bacterium]